MVSLEVVAILLSGISISVSLFYYANVLQNQNKTQQMQLENRQAQLFMNIYSRYASNEAIDNEYIINKLEIKNIEDWYKLLDDPIKYRALQWFMTYYEGIGTLVRENHVSIELVAQMISGNIIWFWERYRGVFLVLRKDWPRMMSELEFLYDRVVEYIAESHPDVSGVSADLLGERRTQ